MRETGHHGGGRGWAAVARAGVPLVLAGCTITPGGVYTPRPAPAPPPPQQVIVVQPPRDNLSGDWVLAGPGGGAPRREVGGQGQGRGRDDQQARGRDQPPGQDRQPPGQDRQPPGQDRQPPGQDRQPPGQDRQGRDEGPPGQVRQEQAALAAGAAPRLRIVQDDHSFTVIREGAVPLTLSYDGRPVYFSDARGATRGAVTGRWLGRGFEVRWDYYGERTVTETYEMTGNGARLTVRTRVVEGRRPGDAAAPSRFVYQRAGERRP